MKRRFLTLAAVTAVTALIVGLVATSPGYAKEPLRALRWGACPAAAAGSRAPAPMVRDPRQRCAVLPVPLNYGAPRARKIDLVVSRISTAKPGVGRGILLLNPGGPGGPGLDLPSMFAALLPAGVLDRYDLIGFDPRGIGFSTPVTCGIPVDTPPDLILPYPAPDGSIDRNVAFARQTALGCAAHSGDLLPFVTTANTARDMDAIRAALGEPKLSYLGYSYGTYLGAVYASLFPRRTDRIILDSGVDPSRVWYQMWRTWGLAFTVRLPDFATWAAAREPTYHLGATPLAVIATYYRVAARLDRDPVVLPPGVVVTGNLFREVTRSLLYDDGNFPVLAEAWQGLAQNAVRPVPAGLTEAVTRARRSATGPPADNGTAALYAVACDDVSWPRDIATYARNVRSERLLFPGLAGMPANIWPCAFWPNQPVERPVTVSGRGPRDVLILQNVRDPATPWITALGLRRALAARAAMVTVDQGGHGVYLLTEAACANDIATAFLVSGALPVHDRFCPGQAPQPRSKQAAPRWLPPGPLG